MRARRDIPGISPARSHPGGWGRLGPGGIVLIGILYLMLNINLQTLLTHGARTSHH